jgi:acetyl esterase
LPIDAQAQKLLDMMAEAGGPPLSEMSPQEARQLPAILAELTGAGPDLASVRDVEIPGPAGAIPARVYEPVADPPGTVVYFHGGGWVIGGLDTWDAAVRNLAKESGARVVSVDYRLAPEHRWPAAVEDAVLAVDWASGHGAEQLGYEPRRVAIGGDSAGGNLAAIVAQRARAAGGPDIVQQVLIYPVTDADVDNASYTDPSNALMLTREAMIWFWDHYAPDPASRRNPDASPLQADDLAGLPPAVVLTAEHDVLRDEGEAYAERLRAAGVPVVHRRFPGQMHGFFTMVNVLPGAADALEYVASELAKQRAGAPA